MSEWEKVKAEFGHLRLFSEVIEAAEKEIERLKDCCREGINVAISQAEEIERLREALLEAMEWNWLDDDAPPRFDLDNLPDLKENSDDV